MTNKVSNTKLFSQIVDLLQSARANVVRTINQTMVQTYFEIGRLIVEEEQKGEKRAEYGKQLLKRLSKKLTKEFGKGFSVDNLENPKDAIKDPYILEFLGLPENPAFTENQLEQELINKLEHFLLELATDSRL